jgi:glucose/arabinose dehydrogenase
MYSTPDYHSTVVERWTDCSDTGTAATTLITLPAGDDCCHKGGRLAFGPDGKLYVTVGDEHSVPAPPDGPQPPVPQQTSDVRGKILRYNPDGSIPADNPFGSSSPVWVAGLRNPFGIAFGPGGVLFVTGNGPTGDAGAPPTAYDIATRVTRGEILQWPYCYGYSHPISPYTSCNGLPPPEWSSESATVVPTGATWVDGSGPPGQRNHFVFCNDEAGMMTFEPGTPHASTTTGTTSCHLDVKQGPDHALYFSDETGVYRLS